jgi:hypothetical protein
MPSRAGKWMPGLPLDSLNVEVAVRRRKPVVPIWKSSPDPE